MYMFHIKNSSATLLVFSDMLSRCITSFFSNLLNKNPSRICKIEWRSLCTSNARYWGKKKGDDGPKIIKPGNCADVNKPLLEVSCKNAVVIGGSEGFGFAAADHLLCMGANVVIIADVEPDKGLKAAQKLCDSYGKNRVHYIEYDIRNKCQAEAGLKAAFCTIKVIHIIFNDLDKERAPLKCMGPQDNESNTSRAIQVGIQFLGKNKKGDGGIIINCASLFGFMGWPHDPYPVYCKKEPVIEVTKDLAKKHNMEETGVRLIALCPTRKLFCDIGLPDFPDFIPNKKMDEMPACIPDTKYHIGTALSHVISWAKSGSAWVVEPAVSIRQIPRLIYFPEKEGDKVDPQVYEAQLQTCAVKLDSHCADTSKACVPPKKQTCITQEPSKKK